MGRRPRFYRKRGSFLTLYRHHANNAYEFVQINLYSECIAHRTTGDGLTAIGYIVIYYIRRAEIVLGQYAKIQAGDLQHRRT